MTNWWTLSAVGTELIGAVLIARDLSLEKPHQWVQGRGTGRWNFNADADLNYATSSTDAAVGFCILAVGLALQSFGTINSGDRGTAWLLVMPALALFLGPLIAREWGRRRAVGVIDVRINELVVDGRIPEDQWPHIVHGYSRALGQARKSEKRQENEDAWAHLDRVYGEGTWLPDAAAEGLRRSYEVNISITHRNELGEIWLPWYVRTDDPTVVITDITTQRDEARQLRIQDIDDLGIREALERAEFEAEGQTWTHPSRIEHFRSQWEDHKSLSPGRFPALADVGRAGPDRRLPSNLRRLPAEPA